MRYHRRYEDMTDAERAERFKYFTLDELVASIRDRGLPDRCTDPDTLRAAAEIHVAAEAEAAARPVTDNDGHSGSRPPAETP